MTSTSTISATLPSHLSTQQPPTASVGQLLVQTLTAVAADPEVWRPLVHFGPHERSRVRLQGLAGLDLWLICWRTFSTTELHDHATSEGAFTVLEGALTEIRPIGDRLLPRKFISGLVHRVEAGQVHDVRNEQSTPAISLHAYTPRLEVQNFYDWRDGTIHHQRTEIEPC
jgi:hypothetical protein